MGSRHLLCLPAFAGSSTLTFLWRTALCLLLAHIHRVGLVPSPTLGVGTIPLATETDVAPMEPLGVNLKFRMEALERGVHGIPRLL